MYPTIQWGDITLYEMGCRRCKRGGCWKFYIDQKRKILVAECMCGHRVKIDERTIIDHDELMDMEG